MIIKVCGMRNPENIRQAAALDIDWMGFIFYEKSPRYVCLPLPPAPSPQERGRKNTGCSPSLVERGVGGEVKRVGVFVNASPQEMMETASNYRLDYLQLHGSESPEVCRALQKRGFAVIKAFPVASEKDLLPVREYEGYAGYFLFDARCDTFGGSGKSFDWSVLEAYRGETPFLLSGGIRPGSAESIRSLRHPRLAGIDLNSGFETQPGIKDIGQLETFIQEIRK